MHMKHRLGMALMFISVAACTPLAAITLAEAEALALENNADLKAQRLKLAAAERESKAKWNTFLPSISVSGGVSNNHNLTGGTESTWNWNASSGVSITLTAGIPAKLKQLTLAYQSELVSYQKAQQSIRTQVAAAYHNLLAAAENVDILEDNLELSRSQYEQARRNYNNGLASELSMLQAQYTYLSAGPALDNARTAYSESLATFQLLIGSETEVVPEGAVELRKIELPSTQELTDKYLDGRLDIQQKRMSLSQAELTKTTQSLSTLAPSINLSESLRVSPENTQASDNSVGVSGTFSVSVSIPVDGFIPGSSKNLTIKSLEDAVESARLSLETERVKAAQDIESKANSMGQLWNAIDIARLNLSIAERSFQLSQEGYNAGLVSQTDLETSRQQMVSARQTVNKSETSYVNAVYNLAEALNLSVEEVYELFGAE